MISSQKLLRGLAACFLIASSSLVHAEAPTIPSERIDQAVNGVHDWLFIISQEFKGGKGELTLSQDSPSEKGHSLCLTGDFSGGGGYVAASKNLRNIDLADITAIRLKVKTSNATELTIRIMDNTKQYHQRKQVKLEPDGKWHDLVINIADFVGGEHWGGANDGKWHGPPDSLIISLPARADATGKHPSVLLSEIQIENASAVVATTASPYQEDFESAGLPKGWKTDGKAAVDSSAGFHGKQSLLLQRGTDEVERTEAVTGAPFPVAAGTWDLRAAVKSELTSPDSSFQGVVSLDLLDGAGNVVGTETLAEVFGTQNWKKYSKRIEISPGVASARFASVLNKTWGRFWVDDLSATPVAPTDTQPKSAVDRLYFSSTSVGNLLLPEDPRTFTVNVEAVKPLSDAERNVSCVLTDYWGSEHTLPVTINVNADGLSTKGQRFVYKGTLDLSKAPLETGRYYEIHGEIPQVGHEPFRSYTAFAILPLAPNKQYKPEQVPFTARNWDNRIPEYIRLADRLGVRIIGILGGWSPTPPYKVKAPHADLCQEMGDGILTTTPIKAIELHSANYEKYTEEALRAGVRNFLTEVKVRPLVINLGNEPHGTGDRVLENVAAYKAVYEEIKKTDPSIFVVGSSAGPNEEYFKAGFGQWCDAYDFHVYEDSAVIRSSIAKYHELFEKYGHPKPIWATELGLNSQGMLRHAVASELIRKTANFFAGGGANMSWFGLIYPDPDGKAFGGSGDTHNVFDCRYRNYAPRLDAIAYYNAVNGVGIKTFTAEKTFGETLHAFHFSDKEGRNLLVCYTDKGRQDVFLPLPGTDKVKITEIDGRVSELTAQGTGITLSITEDPLLLTFESKDFKMPEKLSAPIAELTALPANIIRGADVTYEVKLAGATLEPSVPPDWQVDQSKSDTGTRLKLRIPDTSSVRQADLKLTIKDGKGQAIGELLARTPVIGRVAVQLLPVVPSDGSFQPGVKLRLENNGNSPQALAWKIALTGQMTLEAGNFGTLVASKAYFADTSEGNATVAPGQPYEATIPLQGVDPIAVYQVRATVTDSAGRTLVQDRNIGGFVAVPEAASVKVDGNLDEPEWQKAPVQKINDASQFALLRKDGNPWKGPQDLSGEVRFLWDEKCLYLGVSVTDDVAGPKKVDDMLWAQDGLQLLVDPQRDTTEKTGKYDYALGVGEKGPQAWCYLSADPSQAPIGNVKDFIIATQPGKTGGGSLTYEVAIPWSRLAPFKPSVGKNLGLTLILNEDDGTGRKSFMTWFGNAHTKQVDTAGDLLLMGLDFSRK